MVIVEDTSNGWRERPRTLCSFGAFPNPKPPHCLQVRDASSRGDRKRQQSEKGNSHVETSGRVLESASTKP